MKRIGVFAMVMVLAGGVVGQEAPTPTPIPAGVTCVQFPLRNGNSFYYRDSAVCDDIILDCDPPDPECVSNPWYEVQIYSPNFNRDYCGLTQWDTSTLPPEATIVSARIGIGYYDEYPSLSPTCVLFAKWYTYQPECESGTAVLCRLAGTKANAGDLYSDINANTTTVPDGGFWGTIPLWWMHLTNLSGISKIGTTSAIITAERPEGEGDCYFLSKISSYSTGTFHPLEVCYTLATPTPDETETPTETPTPTPTATPTLTPLTADVCCGCVGIDRQPYCMKPPPTTTPGVYQCTGNCGAVGGVGDVYVCDEETGECVYPTPTPTLTPAPGCCDCGEGEVCVEPQGYYCADPCEFIPNSACVENGA